MSHHSDSPGALSTNHWSKFMHNPEDLVALVTAANFIVQKMDRHALLTEHYPGYLIVDEGKTGHTLLVLHVTTPGHLCDERYAGIATGRNAFLYSHPFNTEDLKKGTTSSDVNPRRGGSVAVAEFAIGYASRDGQTTPLGDEAVAIMIAIKAGLLPKSAVSKRYANQRNPQHNPYLRQLIDTITWTD
jgi:hypothetical protein